MFPKVLATVGGSGIRLYPLTLDLPKPLVELGDTAIIALYFRVLAMQGCRGFILGCKGANNALQLSNYFKAGEGFFNRLGINEHEDFGYQPYYDDHGSADSLKFCMDYYDINEDLLVISGDNHIDIDLNGFIEFHRSRKPILTVALKEFGKDEDASLFGVAKIESDMRIKGFVEKPKRGTEPSRMVNTSFYLFSPQIREVLQKMGDAARDIGADLIPYLMENDYPVYGYPVKGYWIDIGTPELLHQAAMDFLSGKIKHYDKKNEYMSKKWIHPSTLSRIETHLNAGEMLLKGNVIIGRNCRIEKSTRITNSHIGHTSLIERDVEIKNSMIMSFAKIESGVSIDRAIVGRYSVIEEGCILNPAGSEKGKIVVIGENTILPEDSIVEPGTRVSPLKYKNIILATGRFVELGTDEKNIYFSEKVR